MAQRPAPAGSSPIDHREVQGYCTFCTSRCGSINVIEGGRLVAVKPDPSHPTGKALCPKGRAAPEIVHSAERLLYPMRRTKPKGGADPGWTRVSWEDALDEIAARMKQIAARDGPEAVVVATTTASGSSISDAKPWIERFMWSFGTPNLWNSTELCGHREFSHTLTYGRGVATPDTANSDLIVFWGHNPSNTWLALADASGAAHARGAKLAVIDPRRTAMAAQADIWLRVRPGADAILAMAIARIIVEEGLFNRDFVSCWTNAPLLVDTGTGRFLRASELGLGPEAHFVVMDRRVDRPRAYDPAGAASADEAAHFALDGEFRLPTSGDPVSATPAFALYCQALERHSLDEAAEASGVSAQTITDFAHMLGAASSACYYVWTGIGQHDNATQIDRAIATLFALKGQAEAPGGNVSWPTPKINKINDRSTLLSPEQRARTLGVQERPLGASHFRGEVDAQDVYRAIIEHEPYPVRGVVAFGGNPLVSRGDLERGRDALMRLDLHVHCDLFSNPTAEFSDFLLPAGSAWEREALRVGFDIDAEAQRLVQLRPAMVAPVGESRSDFWIAAELAKRLGGGAALFGGDTDRAFDWVLEPTGLTAADLRGHPGGLKLPVEDGYYSYAKETPDGVRGFATPTRRVELYSEALHALRQPPVPDAGSPRPADPDFPLLLTDTKYGHFCHSQHRQIAGLRRRSIGPQCTLSSVAASARGIVDGDTIEISTRRGAITATALVDAYLAPETAVGHFGWWQACDDLGEAGYPIDGAGSANINMLVDPARTDPVANTPRVRSMECQIRRIAAESLGWTGFQPLRVVGARMETEAVAVLELERPDGRPLPRHKPGQFISVDLDGSGASRSYSLINAAQTDASRYAIGVQREAGGAMSPRVAALRPGAIVEATQPSGRFTLPVRHARPIGFIAFGIGVTPFISQLETVALAKDPPEVWMWHGAPTAHNQPFRTRLLELARTSPHLTLVNHLSRARPDDGGTAASDRPGRFTVASIPEDLIARRARFYICGSPEAIAETRAALQGRGVPSFEIFEEKFQSPRALATASDPTPRRVVLERSGREITWPGQGSILEALLQQGVAAPAGCRVGQCESCALGLLEGSVGYATRPQDLSDGECLTCCSFPLTDIRLDL